MNSTIIIALAVIGSVAGLWWLWFVEYQTYRLDLTRHRLFLLRDSLFERAQQVGLPFDSAAYGMTRTTLNGSIRFAHELSLLRLMLIVALGSRDDNPYLARYKKNFNEAVAELSEPQRELVYETLGKMHIVLFSHIARRSLILLTLSEALRLAFRVGQRTQELQNLLFGGRLAAASWRRVDAAANHEGAFEQQVAH